MVKGRKYERPTSYQILSPIEIIHHHLLFFLLHLLLLPLILLLSLMNTKPNTPTVIRETLNPEVSGQARLFIGCFYHLTKCLV